MNKSDSEPKLPRCPLCGSKAREPHAFGRCSNPDCIMSGICCPKEEWQSRPLEQQLRAENDELKKQVAHSNSCNAHLGQSNVIAESYIDKLKEELDAVGADNRDSLEHIQMLRGDKSKLKKQVGRMRNCENCDGRIRNWNCHGCNPPGYSNWEPTNESGD